MQERIINYGDYVKELWKKKMEEYRLSWLFEDEQMYRIFKSSTPFMGILKHAKGKVGDFEEFTILFESESNYTVKVEKTFYSQEIKRKVPVEFTEDKWVYRIKNHSDGWEHSRFLNKSNSLFQLFENVDWLSKHND